ncbi:hypothetical protein [Mucilaginibacter xinganensis]|uniref:DUF922 domain-containing protein n=1 Tax=Mucilaginibacter xinganensis TaxID=1234841 RepID=A0A223P0Z1_9SPHI|nr:hypothetical protein [Mucilaginibacter xinganensis]ASU35746.1 hypothetical protein MuYL_3861 [Mucilaginibacter xinganensis]
MIKPVAIFFCLAVVVCSAQSSSNQNDVITLIDERLPVTPGEFYVANVLDARTDSSPVASLATGTKGLPFKTRAVDLKGGTLAAVKKFINNCVPRNAELLPLIIKLKKISVKEQAKEGGMVEGRIEVSFSFNLDKGEDDMIYLAKYNGNAVYNRDAVRAGDIEPTLRRLMINGLLYINNWMNTQSGANIKLARGVKVNFADYAETPEGDSIYYSVKRPLTWADFQSKVPASNYEAEVFPTLGYDEHTEIINGIINLHIAVKTCLPKSASWVKAYSKNDYSLNHEQRHFDIAKIASEHFKQTIKGRHLTTANYDGPINEEYLDAYREMTNLQKQYDEETVHGTHTLIQQQWNDRIDKELKVLGIK